MRDQIDRETDAGVTRSLQKADVLVTVCRLVHTCNTRETIDSSPITR